MTDPTLHFRLTTAAEWLRASTTTLATLANVCEEAVAALARDAERWQPIETAPKDGADVLLAVGVRVDMGSWQAEQPDAVEGGVIAEAGLPEGWYGYLGLSPWDKARQPTHWQPLPDPPAAASSPAPTTPPGDPSPCV